MGYKTNRPGSPRPKQLNVRLTEDELAQIIEDADARGLSAGEYVRACVQEATSKRCPTCGGTGKVKR